MAVCARCGEANPDHARFCSSCGAALEEAERESGRGGGCGRVLRSRRLDVARPAARPRISPAHPGPLLRRDARERRAPRRDVEKFIGDAVMAVFGVPRSRGRRPARGSRRRRDPGALARLNASSSATGASRSRSRIGVNTGEVVAGEPGRPASSPATRSTPRAARAGGGAGRDPARRADAPAGPRRGHVEPVEPLELKGKADPSSAHLRLLPCRRRRARARLDAPIVGRDRSSRCSRRLRASRRGGACRLFTVLGPPGSARARLVEEFLGAIEETRGRCGVGACRTARASPSGRSPRSSEAAAGSPRPTAEAARPKVGDLVAGDETASCVADAVVSDRPSAAPRAAGDASGRSAGFSSLASERPARHRRRGHPLGRAHDPRAPIEHVVQRVPWGAASWCCASHGRTSFRCVPRLGRTAQDNSVTVTLEPLNGEPTRPLLVEEPARRRRRWRPTLLENGRRTSTEGFPLLRGGSSSAFRSTRRTVILEGHRWAPHRPFYPGSHCRQTISGLIDGTARSRWTRGSATLIEHASVVGRDFLAKRGCRPPRRERGTRSRGRTARHARRRGC